MCPRPQVPSGPASISPSCAGPWTPIAARQRAADEKRKEEAEWWQQAAVVSQSAVDQ